MNEINSFTFYKNYYELIDNLDKKNKQVMLEAIVDYVFKDIEPNLTGMNKAIWTNIVMPINKSKLNSKRSINHNNQKETEEKPISNQISNQLITKKKPNDNRMSNQKETNNISTFLFLISNFIFLKDRGLLRGKIEDWLRYKWERKEYYKELGFKSLLTQIENNVKKYGESSVIELIDECMASNYKGIIWDRLKQTQPKKKDEVMEALEDIYNGTVIL